MRDSDEARAIRDSALPWLLGGGALAAYLWYRFAKDDDDSGPLPGEWVWPVADWGDRPAVISDGWGSDRDGGARKHRGVDIMFKRAEGDPFPIGSPNGSKGYVMPENHPAIAASDGIVWSAKMTERGYAVTIDHGQPSGVATFYQHLSSLAVTPTARAKSGQRVHAGQPLGIVGGDPTTTARLKHLHFEIWRGGPGDATDPKPLMRTFARRPAPAMPAATVAAARPASAPTTTTSPRK